MYIQPNRTTTHRKIDRYIYIYISMFINVSNWLCLLRSFQPKNRADPHPVPAMPSKDAAMVRMGINLGSPEEEAKAKQCDGNQRNSCMNKGYK